MRAYYTLELFEAADSMDILAAVWKSLARQNSSFPVSKSSARLPLPTLFQHQRKLRTASIA